MTYRIKFVDRLLENAECTNLRVLVCGGDGTVQWVLTVIDNLIAESKLSYRPLIAVLPLGVADF